MIGNLIGVLDISHLSIKATNLGVIVGALLFCIGFGTVSTCPGTCVAATGSGGFKKAIAAVVGGLIGAFAFSMTYGYFKGLGLFSTMDLGKLTLFNISEKYPAVFSIGFVGLFITGALFMVAAYFISQKPFKENK